MQHTPPSRGSHDTNLKWAEMISGWTGLKRQFVRLGDKLEPRTTLLEHQPTGKDIGLLH